MNKESIVEQFVSLNVGLIDEKGIYPSQSIVLNQNGEIGIYALAVPPMVAMRHMRNAFQGKPKEMIFGFDRQLLPEQGTTLADGLSVAYYDGKRWRTGIMEYQNEPRIVMPINWDNKWWNAGLAEELKMFVE